MVSVSSLLLPASVRDLASCMAVADVVACATPSSTLTSTSTSTLSVTISYRASATLLSGRSSPLHLRLTWARSPLGGPALSFAASASAPAVLLRRHRGTRSVAVDDDDSAGDGSGCCSQVVLFWDLTAARYDASPEPLFGYYFVAVAGNEVVLAVGDLAAEFVMAKFEGQIPEAPRTLPVERMERIVAPNPAAMPTARVRFAEGGPDHEVSVGCSVLVS